MSLEIAEGRWVRLRYRIRDAQGEAIEAQERELTYLHGGHGAVLPAIEARLAGERAGSQLKLHLEPDDAFGDYDAERVHVVDRTLFPEDLETGMSFQGLPGQPDDGCIYTATDFTEEVVVLDGNHPLAGIALRFEITVVDVTEASAEEIERERQLADEA